MSPAGHQHRRGVYWPAFCQRSYCVSLYLSASSTRDTRRGVYASIEHLSSRGGDAMSSPVNRLVILTVRLITVSMSTPFRIISAFLLMLPSLALLSSTIRAGLPLRCGWGWQRTSRTASVFSSAWSGDRVSVPRSGLPRCWPRNGKIWRPLESVPVVVTYRRALCSCLRSQFGAFLPGRALPLPISLAAEGHNKAISRPLP